MNQSRLAGRLRLSLLALLVVVTATACGQAPSSRVTPWTASRVTGSPEPPLPYKTTRVFSKVELNHPTDITWLPDAKKWIANHAGGHIVSFDNDPENAVATHLMHLSDVHSERVGTAYTTKFHYDQKNQPWCFFVFTNQQQAGKGHHLGRLRVLDPTVPTFDRESMTILARWKSPGHVGSSMQFGPDGMLYVSIGDGQPPYPPDGDNTGQDRSDLRSSILRIDVDDPTEDQPYRVPDDNPFVGQEGVRPEIWAFGFRNPWKIAFDPNTGDLLAADVGWEQRELIHRVLKGRNHGWSIMEGSQQVKPDEVPPVPITPPLFEHNHLDSRSISGGYFWQSDRIPELKGAYLYGDWMTGKVWGLRYEGDEVVWQQELVDTPHRVISFMEGPDGEVYIVAYDGTILRLDPNVQTKSDLPFPSKLSETGLFANVAAQQPAEGVVEYDISAHHWGDGTHSRQWIGVPGSEQLTLFKTADWKTGQSKGRFVFPIDTVVAKTVSYFTRAGDPSSQRHIETQLLHKFNEEWRAYNYIWNEEQTDAILQPDDAVESKLTIQDATFPGGTRTQTWRHASRSECLLCHIWSAGTVHGFWPEQLNINIDGTNQLDRITAVGLFGEELPRPQTIASPHDPTRSLEDRARSYLSLNCSSCHRKLGGGTANFSFDITESLEVNGFLDAPPGQGTFGLKDACVVAKGDKYRSVLLYRMLKAGRGHMPQFGSSTIDYQGVELMSDWVESLGSSTTDESHFNAAIAEIKQGNVDSVDSLLGSLPGAMALSLACAHGEIDSPTKDAIIKVAVSHPEAMVRDLFEHYLPEEQRIKRLGASINEKELLAIAGDVERGRALFETAKDVSCRSCHQIGKVGQAIGPDLSSIGLQQKPAELLASIVRPSEKIDQKFQSKQVLTFDGEVLSGIIVSEDDEQVIVADAKGKKHTIDKDDIEMMRLADKSAMPEQLLSGMTPQSAADLLAYLMAQRKPIEKE